jgi:hypothetical protein
MTNKQWQWTAAFLTITIAGSFISDVTGYLHGNVRTTGEALGLLMVAEQLALVGVAINYLIKRKDSNA